MTRGRIVARGSWRCLWRPGKDTATLSAVEDGWRLSGRGEMEFPDGLSSLRYRIDCSPRWEPKAAEISVRTPSKHRRLAIRVERGHEWVFRDFRDPTLRGCTDLDLSTTPSTNTLALKRLALPVGGSAEILAVWITFPDMEPHPIPQRYTRLGERHYLYEAPHNNFVGEFDVDEAGFVTEYPTSFDRLPLKGGRTRSARLPPE